MVGFLAVEWDGGQGLEAYPQSILRLWEREQSPLSINFDSLRTSPAIDLGYTLDMAFQRRMRNIPLADIKLTDPFWKRWQDVLVEVTLPTQFEQLESTGRLANFEKAANKTGNFEGLWFNDSDVYKFAEACVYALAVRNSVTVRGYLDVISKLVSAAQEPDGYINTFFQLDHPTMKWRNLNMMHEMYCGGHLIEAGVAAFECLGDHRLLDVSIKFADHVMSIFGPDKKVGFCGHEEFELALIKLAGATKNTQYLEFASWMVEVRGHQPSPFEAELEDKEASSLWPGTGSLLIKDGKYNGEYCQDHAPIREHTKVVGHAVRAMYLYIAAAELADGANDEALESALESTWINLTRRRMYVTGGIGPSASNEGFTTDFDLPNLSAYAETCASCGLVFWGQKMLELTGNSEYADITERAIFNGVLSGISLSGDHYFYANPLESRGTHRRTPWFTCACCPPNIARLIGSISNYAVSAGDASFYIHIPAGIDTTVTFNHIKVHIEIKSEYPWSGAFKVSVSPEKPVSFKLYVRIPEWSEEMETDLPGAEEPAGYEDGYAVFDRTWKPGDTLTVDWVMNPQWIEADPRVKDNLGRVALINGPLVYCAEEVDCGLAPQLLSVDVEAPIEVTKSKLLQGINLLASEGMAEIVEDSDELYLPEGTTSVESASPKFIPYFAWNNRGPNNMQVWLRKL